MRFRDVADKSQGGSILIEVAAITVQCSALTGAIAQRYTPIF